MLLLPAKHIKHQSDKYNIKLNASIFLFNMLADIGIEKEQKQDQCHSGPGIPTFMYLCTIVFPIHYSLVNVVRGYSVHKVNFVSPYVSLSTPYTY